MIDYVQDPEGAIREHFQIESDKRAQVAQPPADIVISAGSGITVEKSANEIAISSTKGATVATSEASSLSQIKELLARMAASWQREAAISTSSDTATALRRCASQLAAIS